MAGILNARLAIRWSASGSKRQSEYGKKPIPDVRLRSKADSSSLQQLVSRQRQELDQIVRDDHVVYQPRGFGDVRHLGEQADFLVKPLLEQVEGEPAPIVQRRFEL